MNLLKSFRISESMQNVTKIVSGTMLGQIISMITIPVFTRMYGASVLGTWTIINSIATVVTSFSDLGLKNAIMIEKDEKDTEKLYTIISTITAFFAVLIGFLAVLYYKYINKSMNMNPMVIGVLIGVMIFLTPQTQTSYTWLNKSGRYNILMKNPVIHNISMAVVSIVLGLLGFKKYGYYIGVIVGSVITLLRMRWYLPKKLFNFNFKDYKEVFRTKKEFYLYQMPTNVLGQFKEQVPVFVIEALFGTQMLGYYSIVMKYLKLPINLLAQAIGRVFLQNVAEMNRKGQSIGEYAFKNVVRAIKIAILPLITIYAFGDLACVILFGQDYIISGNILRIVASNSFIMFLMVSCQGMTVVLHQQRANMIASVANIFGYAGGIALGYFLTNNIYVSCAIMTVVYAVIQIIFFAHLFKSAKIKPSRLLLSLIYGFVFIFICSLVLRVILLLLGVVNHL